MCNVHMFCSFISSIGSLGLTDGVPVLTESLGLRDSEIFAGNRFATGRAAQIGQVEGKMTDEKEHPRPPCWGFSRWASNLTDGGKKAQSSETKSKYKRVVFYFSINKTLFETM